MAHTIWERFGTVRNLVEPFAGSLAVLLARAEPIEGVETIGDLDGHIVNVWRSLKHGPRQVAFHLMDPPNSIDMAARRAALQLDLSQNLHSDPEWCHPTMAGYWIYCQSCFMMSDLTDKGQCTPRLWRNGMGVVKYRDDDELMEYLQALSTRLRYVRICFGDWKRTVSSASIEGHGTTAVFLDPPYGVEKRHDCYAKDDRSVSTEVREWALAHEDLRVCLAGYDGEHEMPSTWEEFKWTSHGFVGKHGSQGRENREKERLWFSPACQTTQLSIFGGQ